MRHKSSLLMAGAVAVLPLLLTSCPRPIPYDPGVTLTFRLPDEAVGQKLKLAAVYYDGNGDLQVLPAYSTGKYGPGYDPSATVTSPTLDLYLEGYGLRNVRDAKKCVSPFKTGEAKEMKDVELSVDGVQTCNIYFVAFEDADNDGKPTRAEEKYITHDIYSYASSAFTYRMTTTDGVSTESGSRTAGWSLVRHTVLQPSSTPGKYLVSMVSVPQADQSIAIRLHEPSDYMTSMSLPGGLK